MLPINNSSGNPGYQDDPYESFMLTDFTGGMNNTDPDISLPANMFTELQDFIFTRTKLLMARPPFRPETLDATAPGPIEMYATPKQTVTITGTPTGGTFTLTYDGQTTAAIAYNAAAADVKTALDALSNITSVTCTGGALPGTAVEVEFSGDPIAGIVLMTADATSLTGGTTPAVAITDTSAAAEAPVTVIDLQAIPCSVTNWNYDGRLFVVTAKQAASIKVAAYNTDVEKWIIISSFVSATSVSVCPFKLNGAFDLILFSDQSTPLRWVVGAASTTALGLTAPTTTAITTGYTQGTAGSLDLTTGDVIHYKFSYFYDDGNTSTKYGESPTTTLASDESAFTATATSGVASIQIAFANVSVPANVSKIMIYRAPKGNSAGPYKYIGEVDMIASTPRTIATYTDVTAWGAEGEEDLMDGSDPTVESLCITNAATLGSSIVGFDASIANKMLRSTPGQPDVWNPLDFDYLDGEGHAAIEFNRKIYAFSEHGVYEKATLADPAYSICNIGTIAGKSVCNVGSGLIWMGYDSVYFADFITQYGSKGDFPKDIGHPISKDIAGVLVNYPITAMFRDQRYHVTLMSATGSTRLTYVFDVDFQCWTSATWRHECLVSDRTDYYSAGQDVDGDWYVYRHGYSDTITTAVNIVLVSGITGAGSSLNGYYTFNETSEIYEQVDGLGEIEFAIDTWTLSDGTDSYFTKAGTEATLPLTGWTAVGAGAGTLLITEIEVSDYTGTDYHDYRAVLGHQFFQMMDIPCLIKRHGVRLGGDFQQILVSSVSLCLSGVGISAAVDLQGDNSSVPSAEFSGTSVIVGGQYDAVWDVSVWAADDVTPESADATEHGYAGEVFSRFYQHKKIRRPLKTYELTITISFTSPQNLQVILAGLYYKVLPPAA